MWSSHFDVQGFSRRYWDLFVAAGLAVGAFYLFAAVVALAARSTSDRALAAMRVTVSAFALCCHYGCELQIPIDPPYRFFNRDYSVFDCGGTAFNEGGLKPLVRVCYSVPGELQPCVMLRNVLG
jgi:hypothetical protein